MNKEFWCGKRVFLTGHTGFKGGWLSLWLTQLGAEVTGYARHAPTQPSLFEVAHVARGMNSIIGDVRDAGALKRTMAAAQPLVHYSYANPTETYDTNVMGVVNLLEAARATSGVRSVVNVTSDKCYENKEWPWGYREDEPMGGMTRIATAKAALN